ncbi:MAG: anti-sigma factor, partial [Planctomycetota bacterium]
MPAPQAMTDVLEHPDEELTADEVDQVFAALWRAGADEGERLPQVLRARIAADAEAHFEANFDEQDDAPATLKMPAAATLSSDSATGFPSFAAWSGWLAAAVAGAIIVAMLVGGPDRNPVPIDSDNPSLALSPEGEYYRFAEGRTAAELGRINLDGQYDDSVAEVVWDDAQQTGYLRVKNLPANDAAAEQYQLWIVDATRPDNNNNRVDGGVFDISDAAIGEDGWATIPIDAKLPVGQAAGFAITLE